MDARKILFQIYWKMQAVIAPTLRYSQYLYEDTLRANVPSAGAWLDLGCGHQILPAWRVAQEKEIAASCNFIVGLDYDLPSLSKHETILYRVRGDASGLPFRANTFDLVSANMVVEHLDAPARQFAEIHRILKPGGRFIFHTPNTLGYTTLCARLLSNSFKKKLVYLLEGRKGEDIFPAYYRANSESRIRQLAQSTGFHIEKIKLIVSSAEAAIVPPIAVLELLWIRMLMTRSLRKFRVNIIAILEKT